MSPKFGLFDNSIMGVARNQILGGQISKKSLVFHPEEQINDPFLGKLFSLLFLPATPLSLSRTLQGLFELPRRPSWALASPKLLLPKLQRNTDTVKCAALGVEVSGHCQEQLTQTLIVRCFCFCLYSCLACKVMSLCVAALSGCILAVPLIIISASVANPSVPNP